MSTRAVLALLLAASAFACEREPEPVPIRSLTRSGNVGAGGTRNAIQNDKSKEPLPVPVGSSVPAGGGRGAVNSKVGATSAGAPNAQSPNKFAAALGNTDEFTVAPNKFTKVPYVDELYDDKGQFDITKHRFKAAKSQHYQVCTSLGSFTKDFSLNLYVNGTRESAIANARSGAAQGCRTIALKTGDLLEIWVQQSNDAPLPFSANPFWNWLDIHPVQGSASLTDITEFSAPRATFTKVPYVTERYDVDNLYDVKANRYTAASAGDYHVCATLAGPSPEYEFELDLFINGNRENAFAVSSKGIANGCRTVRLLQGHYVEVWVHQAATVPVKFAPDKFWNHLTIDQIPASEAASGISLDDASPFTAKADAFSKTPYVSATYNGEGRFDLKAAQFKAASPSDYRICASLASLKKDFELDLFVNGVRDRGLAWGIHGIAQACRIVRIKQAGDIVEVMAQPTSPAPIAFEANPFWNWLTVDKL